MKTSVVAIMLLLSGFLMGQIDSFEYKRSVKGVNSEWHKLEIPDEIYAKTAPDFRDLRFYGITKGKDTIEVPYLINQLKTIESSTQVDYTLLRIEKVGDEYHYIFDFKKPQKVDKIHLEFDRSSYDWAIAVDGSENGSQWQNVVDDYRLLAIRDKYMKYSYDAVNLSGESYKYIRIRIPSEANPMMILPKMYEKNTQLGVIKNYAPTRQTSRVDKDNNETIIDLALENEVPISQIKLRVGDAYDYYRIARIECLADSIKQKDGYKYIYREIGSGTLCSIENNALQFDEVIGKKFRLLIENNDNEPLDVSVANLSGYAYEVRLRFSDRDANYFMVYGNENAHMPDYDIGHFQDKIPTKLTHVTLGNEIAVSNRDVSQQEEGALFENNWWLYAVMAVIILLIGSFTLKMMKSAKD